MMDKYKKIISLNLLDEIESNHIKGISDFINLVEELHLNQDAFRQKDMAKFSFTLYSLHTSMNPNKRGHHNVVTGFNAYYSDGETFSTDKVYNLFYEQLFSFDSPIQKIYINCLPNTKYVHTTINVDLDKDVRGQLIEKLIHPELDKRIDVKLLESELNNSDKKDTPKVKRKI